MRERQSSAVPLLKAISFPSAEMTWSLLQRDRAGGNFSNGPSRPSARCGRVFLPSCRPASVRQSQLGTSTKYGNVLTSVNLLVCNIQDHEPVRSSSCWDHQRQCHKDRDYRNDKLFMTVGAIIRLSDKNRATPPTLSAAPRTCCQLTLCLRTKYSGTRIIMGTVAIMWMQSQYWHIGQP